MKKGTYLILFLTALSALGIMAFQPSSPQPYNYEPVMMTRADLEASFAIEPARIIEKPGKLWVYNNFILLIEQYRGIHVIDNSNPNNPQRIAFLRIEGCTEIAARQGILYANNAVDLIGVKANSDFSAMELMSRNRDVMPHINSPEPWADEYYTNRLPDDMVIVRWEPVN